MVIVVLMGVCGCGKTVVGQALSTKLSCKFVDADDWHSTENKAKMAKGIPLTDEDRVPWLVSLYGVLADWAHHKLNGVLACSALKRVYRDILRGKSGLHITSRENDSMKGQREQETRIQTDSTTDISSQCIFVLLEASYNVLASRMAGRHGHFMSPQLLHSQLATLEHPTGGEQILTCDTNKRSIDEIVEYVYQQIMNNR